VRGSTKGGTRKSAIRRWITRRLVTAAVFAVAGALVKRLTATSRGNL
jgi:hypothetical protein